MKSVEIKKILKDLKNAAGSHSPSPKEIESVLKYNPIKYDFCFLSNPYATDLIVNRFDDILADRNNIFSLLEAYPASSRYVAKNIANFEELDADKIVVGNGAIQVIEWVCTGWGLQNVLIPTPTFSSYYESLHDKFVFTNAFWLNSDLKAQKLLELADINKCDSILLIQPNNPTGEAMNMEELRCLIDGLNRKKLIIDESFSHFLCEYDLFKKIRNSTKSDNVVFIKSMSKDFGIAGLRLGYLYSNDHELLKFASSKTTWNLNNFSVLFSEFLTNPTFINEYANARIKYLNVRDSFYNKLRNIESLEVKPTQANFFLIKYESKCFPDLVYDLLIDYGVYVRTMSDKIGLTSSYIRVASRREEENQLFIDSFKSLTKSIV